MPDMVQVPFGHTTISRIRPLMPAHQYKTYGAARPLTTHWVKATCEEIDCEPWRLGWSINAAVLSEQDKAAIKDAGYRWIVVDVADGETQWIFEAGQPCFKSSTHQRETGRSPVFYTRPGDWRGNPEGGRATEMRPEDWVDDMAHHLDRLRSEIEKG